LLNILGKEKHETAKKTFGLTEIKIKRNENMDNKLVSSENIGKGKN
jgi:hypothetical protein